VIISPSILHILKNKYSCLFFSFSVNIFFSIIYSQSYINISSPLNNKPLPFWHSSNQLGVYDKSSSIISESFKGKNNLFEYNFIVFLNPSNFSKLYIPIASINNNNNNNYQLKVGRWIDSLTNESILSTGSLLISKNALPITKISLRTNEYKKFSIFNFQFSMKAGLSHGWMSKERYIKAPLLHEKFLYINKPFKNQMTLRVGLVHEAIWGGETEKHGKQSQSLNDYLRVFTFSSGSKSSLIQEQINTLGNHLGVWDIVFIKIKKNIEFKLYYQHPFEDGSGAYQHFFDELKALRFPSKSFDGLFGIEIINNNSKLFNILLYEYLNTMYQSGPYAASDSTYGWDNYYNHYIYQSGWVNEGRVIGNPLFTLGSNFGHYNNLNYIINNRIKSHHIGISGNISKMIEYKLLFTYSKNYGTYYDQNRFYDQNKLYKFEGGVNQLSQLFEFSFKDIWKNLDMQISYAEDRGQLLDERKGILIKFNYDLSQLSYSQ
jgi:hypothetical protein